MKTTYLASPGLFLGTILAFGSFADFVLVALCGAADWGWVSTWRAGSILQHPGSAKK